MQFEMHAKCRQTAKNGWERETMRVWEQEKKNWIVNFLKASLQTKAESSWSIVCTACRQHISWPGDSSADTLLEIQLQIQIHFAYRRVNTATGSHKHFAVIVMQGLCPLYPSFFRPLPEVQLPLLLPHPARAKVAFFILRFMKYSK